MVTENNAVAAPNPLATMLAKYKKAVQSVLPKHLTPERILRIAHMAISRNPKLMGCTQQSLINGIIQGSVLGLEVGTGCHLVPFFNKRLGQDEAVFIPDYKGLIDLAHRSNRIQSFPFKPVYVRDEFSYSEGTDRHITHKPCRELDRGDLEAAYAIVFYKHGGYDFEVVERADAMAAKAASRGSKKKDSPWNTDAEWTMWCKTAVKRLIKRVPQSPELQFASQTEDVFDATGAQLLDIDVIPMDAITDGSDDKPQYVVQDAPEEEVDQAALDAAEIEKRKAAGVDGTHKETPDPSVDGQEDTQASESGLEKDPLKPPTPSSPAPGKTAKETAQDDADTDAVDEPGVIYAVCSSCNERFDTSKPHQCKPQEEKPDAEKVYTLVGAGGGTKDFEFHDMLITVTGKKDIEASWEAYYKYANGKKPTTFEKWVNSQVKMGVWKYAPADVIEKLLKKFKRLYGKELTAWTEAASGGPASGAEPDPIEDHGPGPDDGLIFPLPRIGDADIDEALDIINDMAEENEDQLRHVMINGVTDPTDGTVYPACPNPTTVEEWDNVMMAFHAQTRVEAAA